MLGQIFIQALHSDKYLSGQIYSTPCYQKSAQMYERVVDLGSVLSVNYSRNQFIKSAPGGFAQDPGHHCPEPDAGPGVPGGTETDGHFSGRVGISRGWFIMIH
jgi:hypothetical protein